MEVGHSCGSRPSDKGGGGGAGLPAPEIRGGARSPKKFLRGADPPDPSPGSATGASQIGEVTCRIYLN